MIFLTLNTLNFSFILSYAILVHPFPWILLFSSVNYSLLLHNSALIVSTNTYEEIQNECVSLTIVVQHDVLRMKKKENILCSMPVQFMIFRSLRFSVNKT